MRNDFDASTVVCLTLAKWETVSGQFGGYQYRWNGDWNFGMFSSK